jgi:hypothetical protein
MTTFDSTSIHRHLDAAFADVPLTPEVQDLKEEIRSNLAARVSELEASGKTSAVAVRTALKEVGDIRDIIAQLGEPTLEKGAESIVAAFLSNKVRPKPGFVIRIVLLSLVLAASIAIFIAALSGAFDWTTRVMVAVIVAGVVLPLSWIVADSLRQETTSNHPLPTGRAVAYGLTTGVSVGGLGLLGLAPNADPRVWAILTGVSLLVAALIAYIYLGVTQTNRKKAWIRSLTHDPRGWEAPEYDADPATEARFGMYSGALWVAAIAGFIALSITLGFAWSWTALVGATILQILMVGWMLFPAGGRKD